MKLPRRKFLTVGAGGIALAATTGCGQLPREIRQLLALVNPHDESFRPPAATEIDPVIHALNRAGFGARPGDYQRVRKMGKTPEAAAAAYLDQQLHPESIEDDDAEYAARRFEALQEPPGELFEYQPDLLHNELMRATVTRAVLSERQLFEVMAQFWSDHFNIDPSKGDCKWLKVADDREVIRKHALGKFSDLLRASALSPAMLWYLDGRVNRRANPSDRPNENYARELLELHTLGVHGGYTQKDVMEVARCLTGWTVRSTVNPPYLQVGKVEFDPALHDFGPKSILGQSVPATSITLRKEVLEQRGRHELERVLQIVTAHPATARHLSAKLCRHFIADDPPASAVAKVADAFSKSEGDIRETLRALFQTDDFLLTRGNKFKRPFTFVVSALRASGAKTDCGMEIIDYLKRMGQAPFNYPTPEGYPDQAPPWMGTLLWRWNFAVALSQNSIKGTRTDLDALRADAGGDEALMAHLLGRKPHPAEAQAFADSGAGLALMLASPGFQWC
jgi:uncharacterized protein (DUF1800 family)